ncbi:discoidin domain-containing protein [Paenibacillus radicis (ex Xue et al. 2023)]|uniref:Discoidin domain-containing protein n=1 Tax=Paenibacillus radicis (ex Xue et al. 2023) TaxID=2972489 RepID=A0ABT1YHV0_9BACL|nr:discoidin domain-containing protein [Paenibacillus radicis (ex Xue et al. 2023)]MCR8632753.1 discoidin domain-containing protein [Paenibacillus radicis (ex Xue et al. 2023)]
MFTKVGRRRLFVSCLVFSLISPTFYGLTAQKASAAATTINLDPSNMQQSWDGWGTSLAWFGNITGGWNDATKNALADALYSHQGLNLNIARYNIGGGENPQYHSMRQGGAVPGYSPSPGVFDWTQDANQRWWLQAAKARGANKLEAFSNSAPYYMTVSGSTTGNAESWKDNLKSDEYDNFANYMAEVVKHFKENWQIDFDYLSPINEPNTNYWGFGGGQEGSHYDVASQMKIINATRAKLDAAGLQSVKIAAMDESILDTFITNWNSYDETTKANIGKMNTHSYGGNDRVGVKNQAKAAGKPLWMSEVDLGPSGIAHNHDDIEPALALAERIMTDITWLEPNGWVLWQAIESEKNMQKDKENMNWGLLHADFDTQQWWYTKKYYAMQQFSKFIPQGSRFIADNNDNTLAAYDPAKNKIYIVYRNPNTTSQDISLDMSQFDAVTGTATPYVSSATENGEQQANVPIMNKTLNTTIGPKSITTFVIDGASYTNNTVIPQSGMTATATSTASGEGPEKTLDGNTGTNWHSAWSGTPAPAPHSITYNLGNSYDDVYQLKYLPRQDSSLNGVATKYEIAVSTDGTNFNKVAEGSWSNDKTEKTATFSAVSATHVKFTVMESNNGSGTQFGSAAEINILRKPGFTVDKDTLNETIASAEALLATDASLTILQSLVNEGKTIRDTAYVTQEAIAMVAGKIAAEYNLQLNSAGRIPQSQMTASSTSSASGEGSAKTLDDDISTKWHTAYDGSYTPLPHSITYKLGKAYDGVYKLSYVPRQDADWNGVVTKFEISVSADGTAFTKVAEGTWDADRLEKSATFNAHGASYVKFTALASKSDAGKQYASAAEINIFNKTGFTLDTSKLDNAMAATTTFINGFSSDPAYLDDLKTLRTQGTTLLNSSVATQEEMVNLANGLTAEIAKIQSNEQQANGISLFYVPEAYASNPSSLMLDNNNSTFYESNWASNGRKYRSGDYIIVDLGQNRPDVGKVMVTPRQDKANGRIGQFKVYYSDADLTNKPANGMQAYLDQNFTFAANGAWDASSSSALSATFKSHKARYVAIQAISTGGDGNTLTAAEIAVSQKKSTGFDTLSLENAITQLRTASSTSPKVAVAIENKIATIGTLSDLTEESIPYYTRILQDLYKLYQTVGKTDSIKSGQVWLDGDGIPIQAHGGGILYNKKNKTYYWYGEDKSEDNVGSGYVPVTGVHAYSSKDLYNWKNEGIVLPVFNNPQLGESVLPGGNLPLYLDENSETYKTSGVPFDPDRVVNITNRDGDYTGSMKSPANSLSKHNSPERIAELNALHADKTNAEKQAMYKDFNWDKVVERPKVVYNKKTDKYVMWWHQDGPIAGEYWAAEGGVAVSDSPTGPFKFLGTSRLPNNGWGGGEGEGMLRDMTLFVDDDDKAYLIYASEGNETEIVMQLNDDYTGPAKNERNQSLEGVHWAKAIWKKNREAPAIFKQDGVYYMITSGTDGWKPVAAQYHTATNILGPWEDKDNPARGWNNNRTFDSQSTFALPYRDANGDIVPNKFIFMGDRWDASNLKDSRYVWLPIELNTQDRTIGFYWHDEWNFSVFKTGTTVNFDSKGGNAVRAIFGAAAGSKITAPEVPIKLGNTFVGWYQDEALTTAWDFSVNTIPATDITLYAKWQQVVPVINSVMPVTVVTATYVPPVLPANVTVVYSDNATANKSVQWNVINPSLYAKVGNFSVNGAVYGTAIPAVANVTVTDNVYPAVYVQSISVSGAGGMNAITVQGGTLQMQAIVLPSGANGQVTWNVWEADGITMTNKATINASGLLTAKNDGIVKVVATAADGSGVRGSNYVVISGQTAPPTNVPHTTLTGAATVQAGAPFATRFGFTNVTNSVSSTVYAADITLGFDTNAIEFVSVDSLKSSFTAVETNTNVPGQIRIIAISEGEAGAITANGDVFKINWKAKLLNSPTITNLTLSKVAVSNALGQKMDASLANLTVSVTAAVAVDKTTLQTVLNLAQSIYDRAVEGTQVGQYAAGSKAVLLAAIQAAAAVNTAPAVSQQQLDDAANVLNQAIQTFNQQIITIYAPGDINGDNTIDIGDLGIIAVNYGKTFASSDWNQIKAADFNHDGKIDIIDLVGVAKLILQ